MTVLEDRIRTVLADQAAELQPPAIDADDLTRVAPFRPAVDPPRRVRMLVAVSVAALAVAAVVALDARSDGSSTAERPPAGATPSSGFRFDRPTVLLEAQSIEVEAGGRSFVPPPDVQVNSDPGTPGEYTTLELTWRDGAIDQRLYLYFGADGTNWWLSSVSTLDGTPQGEPVDVGGPLLTTPLGSAYDGDLDLSTVTIRGMHLEAFRRPAACANPSSPLALVANYPTIDAPVGGYGATLSVYDTTTCTPLPATDYTYAYVSDDPAIVAVQAEEPIPDYPPALTRVGLTLVAPGATTVHATATDRDGTTIGTVDMHVLVRPGDGTVAVPATPALTADTRGGSAPT